MLLARASEVIARVVFLPVGQGNVFKLKALQ